MPELLADLEQGLRAMGGWAYAVAPLVMACVAILPVPAEAPAMLNGMLFDPVIGTAVTWLGAMGGAIASFELGRALGRPLVERLVSSTSLARADRVVAGVGWKGMLFARFLPVVAFTALNWGAGLTPVSRWRFCWTTGLGILPGAVIFTASGTGTAALLEGTYPGARWLPVALGVLFGLWILAHWRRVSARAAAGDRTGAQEER